MAEVTLPDLSLLWSQGGDILKPSDAKIQQGWTAEIPPRQWFNWLDNRQDQAIAHIAQHGISVWSPMIEYQAGKSYVQGSDGLVYKSRTTNINVNPVGGATGNWESAFLTADQATQVATAAQSRARSANNVYISPSQLNNAFNASGQAPFYAVRAWGNIDGRATTPQIRSSGNVASVTRVAIGVFEITFTTAMVNKDYAVVVSGSQELTGALSNQDSIAVHNLDASGFRVSCFAAETELNNFSNITFIVVQ